MKLASVAFLLASLPSLAWAQAPDPLPPPDEAPAPPPIAAPAPAPGFAPSFAPALAPAPAEAATPRRVAPAGPPHYDYLRFGFGFRVGIIAEPGFDAFASDDVLAQSSLDASYAFFTRGKLAVSAGAAWDVGSRTSGARGLSTRLTMHRLTVPIEARWYFTPWLDVFAKVAPGAAALTARVEDPSSPQPLEDHPWAFAADFSGGASIRLAGTSEHAERHPRLWLTQEIGYGLTSEQSLRPRPNRDEADVLGSDQSTRLGSLAVNGVFFRTGLAMTF